MTKIDGDEQGAAEADANAGGEATAATKTTKTKKAKAKGAKKAAKAAKPAKAKKEAKAAKPKAAKTEGEGKRDRSPVIPKNAIIRMCNDAEGKPYGKANNPTREGSAVYDRFRAYKDGITVEKAVAAGARREDIPYHVAKGFITLETPAE